VIDVERDPRERSDEHLHASEVIPLTAAEPARKLTVDRPLAEPLSSRGVVAALSASPRVGHIHVAVDGAPWRWADASGTPVILQALPSGRHTVLIELVDANHEVVDKAVVAFDVP
jgi:hypothetical protein